MTTQQEMITVNTTVNAGEEVQNEKFWITPNELIALGKEQPPALIEGILPSEAVITLAGEPGIGKSFVALDWAASIASGTSWFRRKVRQGPVVYVIGEGWSQFGRRVTAWEDTRETKLPESLMFVDGIMRRTDLASEPSFSDFMYSLERLEQKPVLVVLDTFSMLALVKSENDNAEIARVYARLQQLVRTVGCSVMVVHHVAKGTTQVRGATAFKGNADCVVVAAFDKKSEGASRSTSFFLSTRSEDGGKQRDMTAHRLEGFSITSPGVLAQADWADEVHQAKRAEDSRSLAAVMSGGQEPTPEPVGVGVVPMHPDIVQFNKLVAAQVGRC